MHTFTWVEGEHFDCYVSERARGRIEPSLGGYLVAYVWEKDALVGDRASHTATFNSRERARHWIETMVASIDSLPD